MFERLKKQLQEEERARQSEVAAHAILEQYQRLEASRIQEERGAGERGKEQVDESRRQDEIARALVYRQESGILDKLRYFTTELFPDVVLTERFQGWNLLQLYKDSEVSLDPTSPSLPRLDTPSFRWGSAPMIIDKLTWGATMQQLPDVPSSRLVRRRSYSEEYILIKTSPTGIIAICGRNGGHRGIRVFGHQLLGDTRSNVEIHPAEWRDNPGIFETPIVNAYWNPRSLYYVSRETIYTPPADTGGPI